MARPARPTIRCLQQDLTDGWGEGGAPLQLPSADLDDLNHPVIGKGAQMFPGEGDSEVQRESISGLADPLWYKLKTGRWRGAVYEDPTTGQAWICAAGLRRENDQRDFYAAFMAAVEADGPDAYLPTDADLQRLALEDGRRARRSWERQAFFATLSAVAEAVEARSGTATVALAALREDTPSPASLHISVERLTDEVGGPDAHEDPAEIHVRLEIDDWSDPEVLDVLIVTVCSAISPRPEDWDVEPQGGVHAAVASINEARIAQIIAAATLPDDGVTPVQNSTDPLTHAHYANRSAIFEGTVEGTAVTAMCGICFVPTRPGDGMPICDTCADLKSQLDKRRSQLPSAPT